MQAENQPTIGIFGAGWVGLVTGACFADLGHQVVVRDVVPEKIETLRSGELPFYEPGLPELIDRNRERLTFTLDVADVAEHAELLFVCVGTPPTYSGDADLSAVWTVLDELPRLDRRVILVMKSTVPVGTGEHVRAALDARGLEHVGYVSNPEFLAEGTAIRDFTDPDRVVVGAYADADGDRVAALYEPLGAPIIRCDVASAEMIKLAANAFLTTRISFINEIANVCELVGADVEQVAKGVGLDHRLGPHFLRAGIGWGGSCLAGEESVLIRSGNRIRLTSLEALFAELAEDASAEIVRSDALEVLAWRREAETPEFLPVDAVTRRPYEGELLEVRTKMGRRVRCTPDHPFVVANGAGEGLLLKRADELTPEDWLPVAQGSAIRGVEHRLDVLEGVPAAGLAASDVIVRTARARLAQIGRERIGSALATLERRPARKYDILRYGALRLDELSELGAPRFPVWLGTTTNGTYIPDAVTADEEFWRIVGLYLAEGHTTWDGRRARLQWSFHPRKELDLVGEVIGFWSSHGVKCDLWFRPTTTCVTVSSRLLAAWWHDVLGLGANCYEQRIPDLAWTATETQKRALLAGLWRGDGCWSYVNGGPSITLEYGTVSRELADGILRLLGEVGIVASLRVARTTKSTCDTYWLEVSGADQVESLLDLVREESRAQILESIGRQAKRIAPTGYRRHDRSAAWVRVVSVERRPFSGSVYSLEVPGAHTFVTTAGLVVHNCFGKDVSALKQLAGNSGYQFQLLSAVIEVNELQKRRPVIGKLQKHLGRLRGRTIALLGLAFKPNTDDMRDAPSLVLASRLLAEGAEVRAYDPATRPEELLTGVTFCDSALEAVTGADAAVLVTEWDEFRSLLSPEVREAMRNPLIVDGRNLLDPDAARAAGFVYEGIGRAASALAGLPETQEREPELNL